MKEPSVSSHPVDYLEPEAKPDQEAYDKAFFAIRLYFEFLNKARTPKGVQIRLWVINYLHAPHLNEERTLKAFAKKHGADPANVRAVLRDAKFICSPDQLAEFKASLRSLKQGRFRCPSGAVSTRKERKSPPRAQKKRS